MKPTSAKSVWTLPPSGDDEYLVVRVPKDLFPENEKIGSIEVSLSPTRKGGAMATVKSICCDGLCWSK